MSAAHDLTGEGRPPSPERVWELCEFYILGFDIARLLYGDDGRPLGERYAAARVREGVTYDMRRCPYPGSRSGYEMNVSALRSMQADWPEVLDGVAEIREAFHRRHGHEEPDWRWVWVFGRVLTTLPTLYARRSGEGSRTVVPRRVASLYKPSLGMAMTPEYVMLAGDEGKSVPSPEDFFRETEERGVFLTPDAACSGPVRHVREFLDVCLGPRRAPRSRWVAELVDLDDLISYSWANAELELAKYRFLLSLALNGEAEWGRFFDTPPPSSFDDRPLDELAARLDATVADLGFSDRIVDLGRRDATSPEDWCELFSDLLVPVLAVVRDGSPRPVLDVADVRLMVRHLDLSWRSSGVDTGIELARVPVTGL
ncbi:hypothetical protein AB0E83_09485 [Streptomyces sp. NPDC035033]|uniref:hypothetical protein n=1 Tax=Streptomyces sp. NPDC035033 TaxID=3155368 RepID=UPI0033D5B5E6